MKSAPATKQRSNGLRRGRGFTLVELLVVVSIIALLIAILLPSLKKARFLAQAVVCANQSRQAGVGMVFYLNTYDTFPPHQIRMREFDPTLPHDIRLRWFDLLAIAMDDTDQARTREMTPEEWEDFKRDNIYFQFANCPATPDWDVGRNNSMGYNYKYLGSFRDNNHSDNPWAPKERFPVKGVRNPAATIAFADCDGTGWKLDWRPEKPAGDHNPDRYGNHGYILDPTFIPIWSDQTYSGGELEPYSWHNWRTYLSERHMGTSNATFADGHTERVAPRMAYRDNAMWNGLGVDPGADPNHPLYNSDPHVPYKWDEGSGQEWRYN